MIPINKNFTNRPARLEYNHAKIVALLEDLKLQRNNHAFNSYRYRECTISELKALYKNKCGYCESDPTAGSELRVDHYRPKNGIDGLIHDGYYWLCYEWSNLVLACEKCNGAKSNKFPIMATGTRIINPPLIGNSNDFDLTQFIITNDIYTNEEPLLVNPEIDRDLKSWFYFSSSGKIYGLNAKANATIEVCDLNRETLLIARKKIINTYQRRIRTLVAEYLRTEDTRIFKAKIKDVFDELKVLQKEKNIYSRLGYFIFIKFDLFVIRFMKNKSRQLLSQLYRNYLNGNY